MKTRVPLITFSFTLVIISSFASVTSYNSPNNLGNIKSILYLKDGRTCTGYLSINKEHKKNDKISIQSGNNSKPQFFKSKKVKGNTIGDDHFYLKDVGNNTLVIEKWNSFLEQPF